MSVVLALAGFALLAGGTYRQAHLLFGTRATASRRRMSLLAGAALLTLSLVHVLASADWARGLIAWFGELTLAALLVVGLLWLVTHRPGKPLGSG